jgi:hypothetical protein
VKGALAVRDGTRDHHVELASLDHQRHHPEHLSPSTLDMSVAAELGLLETLEVIKAAHAPRPDPAQARITLSRNGQAGQPVGNPAEWTGFPALSIVVYNANAFAIQLGAGGSGSGDVSQPQRGVAIAGNRLAVLPIADEVYSFGTAAANVAAADAVVWAWRYATLLAPAVYAL